MFSLAFRQVKTALSLLLFMSILTGVLYPVVVTGIAQTFFSWQANGSMIEQKGKVVGSLLIGQSFSDPKYFWGRPSATSPFPYNAAKSAGSNLGPLNPALIAVVKARVAELQMKDPTNPGLVPIDLVTASGSGLDPDISPLAAFYQVSRIAKNRNVSEAMIRNLIVSHVGDSVFSKFGENRVNVLQINLALDAMADPALVSTFRGRGWSGWHGYHKKTIKVKLPALPNKKY